MPAEWYFVSFRVLCIRLTPHAQPFEDFVILDQTNPDLTTCDLERLQRLQYALAFPEKDCSPASDDIYCKLVANTTNLALSGITRVMLAPGVQSTVTWANCQKFVQTFLRSSINDFAPDNTGCWATPGSEDYATDPCCNIKCASAHTDTYTHPYTSSTSSRTNAASSLLWTSCCTPRPAPPVSWAPEDDQISGCRDSDCAYNVRSALLVFLMELRTLS